MNKNLKNQIDKVKKLLNSHPDVIEYNALAKEVKSSSYIKEKEELLKSMQKELVHLTNENDLINYESTKARYQTLKKEFDEYPLYANYLQAKEKVNDLLVQISEILSDL